ncbi:MAG: quinol oxidase [Nitrososphaerota archaeon]|nr:quinol oxidase [Nitrososphaerota archaeon]
MKKRNVLVAWTLILFMTVVVLEVVYTPYDYAGYQIANNVGEGVAQADYPPIQGPYQVVYVTCEQWQFLFYPHLAGAPTVTVLQANIPVLFIIRSVDVTHGFYVNTESNFVVQGFQFGVMAVPGYTDYVTWNFQPTQFQGNQSLYHVFCSEYCGVTASGLGHPWMDALIIVVPNNGAGQALQSKLLQGNTPEILNGSAS